MNELVAQGSTEPTLLPFGTWGPLQLGPIGGDGAYTEGSAIIPTDEFYAGAALLPLPVVPNDGEFNLPALSETTFDFPRLTCRHSASDGGLGDATDAFFGPITTVAPNATRFDAGYGDYLRALPQGVSRVDDSQSVSLAGWLGDADTKWSSWQ